MRQALGVAGRRAEEPGPPLTVPRAPAREAAEEELSRQIYADQRPGLFRRAFDWVWEHVFEVLDSLAIRTPGGWWGLAVIILLVAALVVALRMRLGPLRGTPTGRGDGTLFGERLRTADEHRAAAAEHAAAGRWNEAVQERLRAIVRSLEERALLDPRPGRTADEAAAEAGRVLPGLAARLHTASGVFDAVTYGGQQAGPQDHAQLHTLDEELARTRPDLSAVPPAGAAL
ncbi:DUF4129 domain-containing protein [Streptomyces sodiiphilus]|uniref:DUF4129 domain-containing protein n=1 Tax=Streptomyces sodiiphilus TaxID=226217 RepID=A0ABN2PUK1_9ACTN